MRYAKIIFSFIVIFSFCASGAMAQKAVNLKIAYVDVGRLFDGYNKTKDYDSALEKKYSKYEEQRDKRLGKIRDAEGKLALLKKGEKSKIQGQIEKDKADLLEFDRQHQTDLKRERDEKIREILLEIEGVIRGFAEKGKYTIILNDKVLVYGQESLDVTDQVLKELNKK